MANRRLILVSGTKYGRLTVLRSLGIEKRGNILWECLCDCGQYKKVKASNLISGRVKSCGCIRFKNGTAFRKLLCFYRCDARRRGHEFLLDEQTFKVLTSSPCFYCGLIPYRKINSKNDSYSYNGIDRTNNLIDYVPENCVPCCWQCNKLKGVRDIKPFLAHIERLSRHRAWEKL